MAVWVGRIGCMAGNREWEWGWDAMGGSYYWYAEKWITYQSTSFIFKHSCKTEANSV